MNFMNMDSRHYPLGRIVLFIGVRTWAAPALKTPGYIGEA